MSTPTDENRLGDEQSPYLRQHADNPVNWQPWDDQALEAAREHEVPIFLSIGYSSCHWCHVMEEESFEDGDIAEVLNERFVPIKVDREERPDVDRIYQTICQAVTRRGGWPLSVWLTPEGKPFYVGTYFPKQAKRGMPGFGDLLSDISDSWSDPEQRVEMKNRAEQWTSAIKGELEDVPEPADQPPSDALSGATAAALRAADREEGGFGSSGPKFPQPSRVELLMRAHERTGREPARGVVIETLDAMANGGLYDQVGGGFHRYATDRDWTVPHFEKMLYDNGDLPALYARGVQFADETADEDVDRFETVTRETLEFLDRELRHPEGAFYSTLDARSATPENRLDADEEPEQEEGAFYTWTPAEVREAMATQGGDGVEVEGEAADDDLLADLAIDRWGVTERGNFEGETVLTIAESVESLAASYDLTEAGVASMLEEAQSRLLDYREQRPRPRRDEKILAGWNGLAISALAEGALVLGDRYADWGTEALSFLEERLWDGDERRLNRRFKDGEVKIDGYLEDYAFLARGAFDLYGVTADVSQLAFALDLAWGIREHFWDDNAGTLYFTPQDGEKLVARPQEATDQSTPSSLGVALSVFARLDHFVPHDGFAEVVERTLETYANRITGNPLEHTTLALVADEWHAGQVELTLAVEGGLGDWPEAWREALAGTYLPARILAPRPPTEEALQGWLDELQLEEAPPIWADRDRHNGHPTVYACRNFACSPPTTEMDDALAWLTENA